MRTVLDPILFLSSPVHVTACDCDLVLRAASATPPAPPPRLDHVCAGVYATLEITSEKAHKAARALQLITEEADPSLLTDIEGQLTCPNACPGVFMVAHLRPQSCSIHKVKPTSVVALFLLLILACKPATPVETISRQRTPFLLHLSLPTTRKCCPQLSPLSSPLRGLSTALFCLHDVSPSPSPSVSLPLPSL